ncbi:hypothetical protein GOV09_02795 [Candidatus Woesearchaeota archaeon]|nr:hypothetical protein [Candidatus Woesearchaeota archaeon]
MQVANMQGAAGAAAARLKTMGERPLTMVKKMYKDSRDLFHEEVILEKSEDQIETALHSRALEKLRAGDKAAIQDLIKLVGTSKDLFTVEAAFFGHLITRLAKVIQEEKQAGKINPEVEQDIAKLETFLRKFQQIMDQFGSTISSEAHSI